MTNAQVKEAINSAITHLSELQQAKMQLIINNLQNIDAKLTKQNGSVADTIKRVADLERISVSHSINCPHNQTIQSVSNRIRELDAVKKSLRNWILIATAFFNSIAALIIYLLTKS
jgi:hypothetical protein